MSRLAAILTALGVCLSMCLGGTLLGTPVAEAQTPVATAAGPPGTGLAAPPVTPGPPTTPPAGRSCTVRVLPPPAVDNSEVPRPGEPPPGPLPVPARPVGGPRLGECADILPPGAPALPAGVTSASWVLADLNSGAVLAAHDPHARHRPASTLKVLTALVVLRSLDLNTVVDGTLEDENVHGSRVGMGPGGRYTVRQLLTGLILNSGNDAANALARQLGGVPATLAAMSDTARRTGALDTRPTSPSGLDAPGMATSAYDLAALFRVAMRDPTFAEISRTRHFEWPGYGGKPGFTVSSDNKMLAGYPGTIGGKTGFTDDARHTRIVAAERGGRRLVVTLVRAENRPVPVDSQAARLLDWGFALHPDTPSVGTLVDQMPPEDATPEEAAAAAAGAPEREHRLAGLAVIAGGALVGGLLSLALARRRPKGRYAAGR